MRPQLTEPLAFARKKTSGSSQKAACHGHVRGRSSGAVMGSQPQVPLNAPGWQVSPAEPFPAGKCSGAELRSEWSSLKLLFLHLQEKHPLPAQNAAPLMQKDRTESATAAWVAQEQSRCNNRLNRFVIRALLSEKGSHEPVASCIGSIPATASPIPLCPPSETAIFS